MTAANERATGTLLQAVQLTLSAANHAARRFDAGTAADEMKYVRLHSG
ncbi:hypothetical protein [Mycolicibacterium hippocampi]